MAGKGRLRSTRHHDERVSLHEGLEQARDALEAALSRPAEGAGDLRWGLRLQQALGTLADALEDHRDRAEREGGFLDEIVAEKPALKAEADRLRDDHADLLHRAIRFRARLDEQLAFRRVAVGIAGLEANALFYLVSLHIARARDVVYEAYFQEEGGEEANG